MDESEIVFKMKSEFGAVTPDLWSGIEKKVKKAIKDDMLKELSKVPSPGGTFLRDRKERFLDSINRIGA